MRSLLIAGICLLATGAAAQPTSRRAVQAETSRATPWLRHGGDEAETHFSPLAQINAANVQRLQLAWSYDTETQGRLESTPLVADGTLYATATWSVVFALDARSGALRWRWDPHVNPAYAGRLCCGPANRGVALAGGKVLVGVLDGRLAALDQHSGALLWETQTTDPQDAYTITGAPRVIDDKVIIGNGGADFGLRGYVSAYNINDGQLIWRFYIVPGDPALPFENPELARAATTWTGEWWKMGGGGTAWDSFSYDPRARLLYVGTGNGGPWNRNVRSPGGGDNLYIASILALRPDNGALAWYYQTTPGDSWDFGSTQTMILADLSIGGRRRKVLMQAPKNGFFYVLDRISGELISAAPFTDVNWATHIDKQSGRPVELPAARYEQKTSIRAGFGGAHNWPAMSFNPQTQLAYIPGQNVAWRFAPDPQFAFRKGELNSGASFEIDDTDNGGKAPGFLSAWDPVKQKERWRVDFKSASNGGTLTTAGNLVFHGSRDGDFAAYSADRGQRLWQTRIGAYPATPITYMLDGKQFVSILAGNQVTGNAPNELPSRLWTFALAPEVKPSRRK